MIDNAEEIAGDYEYETGVDITISLMPNEIAEIKVATTYIPKNRKGNGIVSLPNGATGNKYRLFDKEK